MKELNAFLNNLKIEEKEKEVIKEWILKIVNGEYRYLFNYYGNELRYFNREYDRRRIYFNFVEEDIEPITENFSSDWQCKICSEEGTITLSSELGIYANYKFCSAPNSPKEHRYKIFIKK